jgi:hypothetical protein
MEQRFYSKILREECHIDKEIVEKLFNILASKPYIARRCAIGCTNLLAVANRSKMQEISTAP